MSYRGRMKNGVVVFDSPVMLADGAKVEVHPVADHSHHNGNSPGSDQARDADDTLYDRLLRAGLIGCIDDPNAPTDLSTNKAHMDGFGRG